MLVLKLKIKKEILILALALSLPMAERCLARDLDPLLSGVEESTNEVIVMPGSSTVIHCKKKNPDGSATQTSANYSEGGKLVDKDGEKHTIAAGGLTTEGAGNDQVITAETTDGKTFAVSCEKDDDDKATGNIEVTEVV